LINIENLEIFKKSPEQPTLRPYNSNMEARKKSGKNIKKYYIGRAFAVILSDFKYEVIFLVKNAKNRISAQVQKMQKNAFS